MLHRRHTGRPVKWVEKKINFYRISNFVAQIEKGVKLGLLSILEVSSEPTQINKLPNFLAQIGKAS